MKIRVIPALKYCSAGSLSNFLLRFEVSREHIKNDVWCVKMFKVEYDEQFIGLLIDSLNTD